MKIMFFFSKINIVIKKELLYFFNSMHFYIALLLMFLFNGLFLDIFEKNILSLDSVVFVYTILLVFLIPALTMHSFASEKNSGTIEILFTKPFTDLQIILGKYLSIVYVYFLMLFSVFLFDTLLFFYLGDPDVGVIIGSFLALLFYGMVLISIGIFSSALTNSQFISFLISFGISSIYFLVGKFISYLPLSVVNIFSVFVYDFHFENLAKGVIDSKAIIYFLLVISLFLFNTFVLINKRNLDQSKRSLYVYNFFKFINIFLFVLLIISMHIISLKHYFRIDITESKLYSLTDTTKKILSNLVDHITIKCYISDNVPLSKSVKSSLKNILEEYKALNPVYISYFFENPLVDKNIELKALSYGIQPLTYADQDDVSAKIEKMYMGIVLYTNDKTEVIPVITINDLSNLEYLLSSRIYKLHSQKLKKIYITQGKGIHSIENELSSIVGLLSNTYEINPLNVIDENGNPIVSAVIPKDTDLLIAIDSPYKYPQNFLINLKKSIKNGLKVIFFDNISHIRLSNNEVVSNLTLNNFSDILKEYGIYRNTGGMLADLNSVAINVVKQQGYNQVYSSIIYPVLPIIKNINKDILAISSIKDIYYAFGSVYNNLSGAFITSLAKSSQNSFLTDPVDIYPLKDWDNVDKSNKGPFDIGYKVSNNNVNFFVIGSIDMINNIMGIKNKQNFDFIQNIVDFLISDIDISSMRLKSFVYKPINKISFNEQLIIKYIYIIILPLCIFIIGILKFYIRKKYTS